MPESPDFEQIAERLLLAMIDDGSRATISRARIAEQLRLVWNARGAADVAAVGACQGDPQAAARGYGRVISEYDINRAIRKVDR